MPGSFRDPNRPAGSRDRRVGRCAAAGLTAAALVVPLLTGGPTAAADGGQPRDRSLQREFTEAAQRYRVPESVLLGVSYLQSRWDTHQGAPSVSGGYGPMHLTDARAALAASRAKGHSGSEDARGDSARPARTPDAGAHTGAGAAAAAGPGRLPARLRTLEHAARLTGLPREELRTSPAANVRGGAALLAEAQKKLGRPLSADPADWYGAVAAYPGGGAAGGAGGKGAAREGRSFADDVFGTLRAGERRTNDAGDRLTLQARPGLRAAAPQVTARSRGPVECPSSVDCEWLPAPYEKYTNDEGEEDYGNHDRTRRPASQKIDYIVVHDTEETYEKTLKLVQDPAYVSWNYTLRSADGHIAQHVKSKDTAWHAGNWYVNSTSVGLEHEGFLTDPDAWYTEAMYRSSARLVRYLAKKHDIPLDRQHILGHDNVPGTTPAAIKGMHTDPGPYWDWQHYFALLGRPFTPEAPPGSPLVTIAPDYEENRPVFTGCEGEGEGKPCKAHGSSAVRLHTAPDADAPLVEDIGLHPDGGPSTTGVNDTGARATTGQKYAVAGRKGEWTAIWYLGQKAWFHDPEDAPAAFPARGTAVEPRPGKDGIPVYGRAYPEKEAYPEGVPVQDLVPLPYKVRKGERYAAGLKARGTYLYATDFDPGAEHFKVVRGKLTYYQIQLGHRVAFVRADDVRVVSSR